MSGANPTAVARIGLLAVIVLMGSAEAFAQSRPASRPATGERVVRVLGAPRTRFNAPVNTVASLRRFADTRKADLQTVLGQASVPSDVADKVVAALAAGEVTETLVAPGTHLDWMALRRRGKPDVLRNVRWGGRRAFPAYTLKVESETTIYTFVVPKACGNLSLVGTEDKPAPPPPPPPPPPPAPAPVAPPPPPPPPPPAPVAEPAPEPAPVVAPAPLAARSITPFVFGGFGKQRRDQVGDVGALGAFCDPILGIKGGVQFQPKEHFVIAPAAGVAINFDEGDRSALFADLELNYVFDNGGYVGSGVGVWDITDGDNVTPNLLLHAGVPLTKDSGNRARLLFAVEGRLFFDEIDHIDNNYQFWAGLRFVFR